MKPAKFVPAVTKLTDYTYLDLKNCDLAHIATIISNDWRRTSRTGMNYAAKPYVAAMMSMSTIKDNYAAEDGRSIVLRFLVNASGWRGLVARAVKAHLNSLVK